MPPRRETALGATTAITLFAALLTLFAAVRQVSPARDASSRIARLTGDAPSPGPWLPDAAIQGGALAMSSALLLLALGLERGRRREGSRASAQREIDARYRLLAENTADLVTLRPRRSFVRAYVSPSVHDMLGWTPEEFGPLPDHAFVHPDDLDRVRQAIASLSAERSQTTILQRLRRKDGGIVHVARAGSRKVGRPPTPGTRIRPRAGAPRRGPGRKPRGRGSDGSDPVNPFYAEPQR